MCFLSLLSVFIVTVHEICWITLGCEPSHMIKGLEIISCFCLHTGLQVYILKNRLHPGENLNNLQKIRTFFVHILRNIIIIQNSIESGHLLFLTLTLLIQGWANKLWLFSGNIINNNLRYMNNRNNMTEFILLGLTESKDAENHICCVFGCLHHLFGKKCAHNCHHHHQPITGVPHVLFPGSSLIYWCLLYLCQYP